MEPLTPEQLNTAGVLFGLVGIASIVTAIVGAYNALKRKPNIDITLQEYSKKEDLRMLADRVDNLARQLFERQRSESALLINKIDDLSNSMHEWAKGVERQIGKLEGKIEGGNK